MKAVIMAGGMGTRIASIANGIPKPLIPVCGKPVLQHEIECLRDQGFTDILITVGYMANAIVGYFNNGSEFGVNIEYYVEKVPLGNAGALYEIKDKLTDDFLLLNADSLFNIDFNRFVNYHYAKGGCVTLFTHPNSHPYDSGLLICDDNKSVLQWLSKEDERPKWYRNRVNAGLHVINKKVLGLKVNEPKIDLDRHLLKPLSGSGKMFAYDSPEYVRDMGTPDRYFAVCNDSINSVVQFKNLKYKQKAIFIDLDRISEKGSFLENVDCFKLVNGVSEAIKKINSSYYLAIIYVSQSAKTCDKHFAFRLNEIHKAIDTALGNDGAYIDGLYFRFCYPSKAFGRGELGLKDNRKHQEPRESMFIKASHDLNVDLSQSWVIHGDNDVFLCVDLGCKIIELRKGSNLLNEVNSILNVN